MEWLIVEIQNNASLILSLSNIVPSNRNALGPAFFQSQDSIVEEWKMIWVLQLAT